MIQDRMIWNNIDVVPLTIMANCVEFYVYNYYMLQLKIITFSSLNQCIKLSKANTFIGKTTFEQLLRDILLL